MLFNSISFVIFLTIVLCVIRIGGLRARNWLLLLSSIAFYTIGSWMLFKAKGAGNVGVYYTGLLGFNCMIAYYGALRIAGAATPRGRRAWCTACVSVCVGLLCYFKYRGFFLDNFHTALATMGWEAAQNSLSLILPAGISFFTFQAIAYVVDVHRGTTQACRNLRDFLLFKTFFPQLIAGPIERANNLLPQIQNPRRVTNSDIIEGLYLVLWGYCKKVVIADNLALKIASLYNLNDFTAGDVFLAALGFTFQVYGDFSGYTDIARGVARWFGVNLMQNFNYPYFATSPQDFWRRWHISLGSWLREYLYIPLGGNRGSSLRTNFNLLLTMLIGGLWHGPSWSYIIWGAYQGVILIAHRTYVKWRGERRHTHLSRICSMAVMFLFTIYGMFIFRLDSWEKIVTATAAITHFQFAADFLPRLVKMLPYIALILAVETPQFLSRNPWFFVRRNPIFVAAFFLFLFYTILILGVTGGDQFIYFAF